MQYIGIHNIECFISDCSKSRFCLLEAINGNGLAFFMLANLLTGFVNFSMETIFIPPNIAYCVLVGYMLVLSLTSAFLDAYKINLKFW
jgi:phosphatidylinositol glycan class W